MQQRRFCSPVSCTEETHPSIAAQSTAAVDMVVKRFERDFSTARGGFPMSRPGVVVNTVDNSPQHQQFTEAWCAQPVPKLVGVTLSARRPHSVIGVLTPKRSGGRNRDRTCDLYDVNVALVPTELCARTRSAACDQVGRMISVSPSGSEVAAQTAVGWAARVLASAALRSATVTSTRRTPSHSWQTT